MANPTPAQFRKQLAQLDSWLEQNRPDVFRSLRPPASERQLASLSGPALSGKPVPPLIEAWFKWHNGQSLDGPGFLSFKNGWFYLIPISEAIQIARDMKAVVKSGDIPDTWSEDWLPLLAGDFGDFLVFVRAGQHRGRIRVWWHERCRQEAVADDLSALLTRARRALAKDSPKRPTTPDNSSKEFSVPKSWLRGSARPIAGPASEKQLAQDAVGTAYSIGPLGMPIFHDGGYYVAIKVGPDLWISVYDFSPQEALKAIAQAVSKVPRSKWAHTNKIIAGELVSETISCRRPILRRTVTFCR